MHRGVFAGAIVLLTHVAIDARAQSSSRASQTDPPVGPSPYWYGWQTLAFDGVVALDVASFGFGHIPGPPSAIGTAWEVAGVTTYLAATPIVHWAHGNVGEGFGSLAMRTFAPLVGLGVGFVLAWNNSSCFQVCFETFTAAGLLVGPVVDASLLAWASPPQDARATGAWLAPALATRRDGGTIGVQGGF
jgi:hypothetical protein